MMLVLMTLIGVWWARSGKIRYGLKEPQLYNCEGAKIKCMGKIKAHVGVALAK